MSGPSPSSHRFEIAGLLGFILSGALFTISSIRYGDPWALAGSVAWIVACVIWLVPLVRK